MTLEVVSPRGSSATRLRIKFSRYEICNDGHAFPERSKVGPRWAGFGARSHGRFERALRSDLTKAKARAAAWPLFPEAERCRSSIHPC